MLAGPFRDDDDSALLLPVVAPLEFDAGLTSVALVTFVAATRLTLCWMMFSRLIELGLGERLRLTPSRTAGEEAEVAEVVNDDSEDAWSTFLDLELRGVAVGFGLSFIGDLGSGCSARPAATASSRTAAASALAWILASRTIILGRSTVPLRSQVILALMQRWQTVL